MPPETYKLSEGVLAAFMASAGAGAGASSRHPSHAPDHLGQGQGHGGSHPHSPGGSPQPQPLGHHGPQPQPQLLEQPSTPPPQFGTPSALAARAAAGGGASTSGGQPMLALMSLPSSAASLPSPHHQQQHASHHYLSPIPASTALAHRRSNAGGRVSSGGEPPPGQGHGGRPTGQQVAVMLAQQQLSSVVHWCRQRMVWEVLLVQLQAVGAQYVELAGPPSPCQRLRVVRLAGTALPCRIVRRPGLVPQHVGPLSLELEVGPDALAGQVTARLCGAFFSSQQPPGSSPAGCVAAAGHARTRGFTLAPSPPTAAGPGSGGICASGSSSSSSMVVCLERVYCLERGDSALSMVQDVAAVIRMQALLARLEMLVHGGQQLSLIAPPIAAVVLPVPPQTLPAAHQRHAPDEPAGVVRVSAKPATATAAAAPAAVGNGPQSHPAVQEHPVAVDITDAGSGGGCGAAEGARANGHASHPHVRAEPMPMDTDVDVANSPAAKRQRLDLAAGHPGLDHHHHHAPAALPTQPSGSSAAVAASVTACGLLANGSGARAPTLVPPQSPLQEHERESLPPQRQQQQQQEQAAQQLTWVWPLVGTVVLQSYTACSAMLQVTAPEPPSPGPGEAQQWRQAGIGPLGGSGSGPPTGAAAGPGPRPSAADDAGAGTWGGPLLLLSIQWAPRDNNTRSAGGASASGPGAQPTAAAGGGVGQTPAGSTPGPPSLLAQPLRQPPTTTRVLTARASAPEHSGGSATHAYTYTDLVLCTLHCPTHTLPPEFLHALEVSGWRQRAALAPGDKAQGQPLPRGGLGRVGGRVGQGGWGWGLEGMLFGGRACMPSAAACVELRGRGV